MLAVAFEEEKDQKRWKVAIMIDKGKRGKRKRFHRWRNFSPHTRWTQIVHENFTGARWIASQRGWSRRLECPGDCLSRDYCERSDGGRKRSKIWKQLIRHNAGKIIAHCHFVRVGIMAPAHPFPFPRDDFHLFPSFEFIPCQRLNSDLRDANWPKLARKPLSTEQLIKRSAGCWTEFFNLINSTVCTFRGCLGNSEFNYSTKRWQNSALRRRVSQHCHFCLMSGNFKVG